MVEWRVDGVSGGALVCALVRAIVAVLCMAIASGLRVLPGMITPEMTVFAPYLSATLLAVLAVSAFAGGAKDVISRTDPTPDV